MGYHIKRTSITVILHSFLPLVYCVGLQFILSDASIVSIAIYLESTCNNLNAVNSMESTVLYAVSDANSCVYCTGCFDNCLVLVTRALAETSIS